jgi:hypothetical protein
MLSSRAADVIKLLHLLIGILQVKPSKSVDMIRGHASQAYTYGEHCDWLTKAGFTDIDRVIQTGGTSIITAHKPS